MQDNIGKKELWRYVNRRLNRTIHRYHVWSVINLLFEEIVYDLQQGKPINIPNLGIISLQTTKPRKHYHIHLQRVVVSTSYRLIKFLLAPRLRKKLIQFLDIDRTFNHD